LTDLAFHVGNGYELFYVKNHRVLTNNIYIVKVASLLGGWVNLLSLVFPESSYF